MSKIKWFWRTLTGYKVAFVSVDYENYLVHRPFRKPEMKSTRITKSPNSLQGKSYEMLIYDEITDWKKV